ncbi:hypothetical protein CLV48_108189 [Cecembia rubra]|uniref:Uncharacterized protein n=1 Tax=Cecembia rubra TaxID=1485585 RepID=A0A2P8E0U8_9BACT|nr:hypothetical protein CLV48_108189 [Cecembia rubra]
MQLGKRTIEFNFIKKTALIERCFLYEESLLVNLIITLNRPGMVYLHWQTWSQFRIHRKYSPI